MYAHIPTPLPDGHTLNEAGPFFDMNGYHVRCECGARCYGKHYWECVQAWEDHVTPIAAAEFGKDLLHA